MLNYNIVAGGGLEPNRSSAYEADEMPSSLSRDIELPVRIELTTSSLQVKRTTIVQRKRMLPVYHVSDIKEAGVV